MGRKRDRNSQDRQAPPFNKKRIVRHSIYDRLNKIDLLVNRFSFSIRQQWFSPFLIICLLKIHVRNSFSLVSKRHLAGFAEGDEARAATLFPDPIIIISGFGKWRGRHYHVFINMNTSRVKNSRRKPQTRKLFFLSHRVLPFRSCRATCRRSCSRRQELTRGA